MGDKEERKLNEDLRKSTVHTRPDPSTGPPDIINLNPKPPQDNQNNTNQNTTGQNNDSSNDES